MSQKPVSVFALYFNRMEHSRDTTVTTATTNAGEDAILSTSTKAFTLFTRSVRGILEYYSKNINVVNASHMTAVAMSSLSLFISDLFSGRFLTFPYHEYNRQLLLSCCWKCCFSYFFRNYEPLFIFLETHGKHTVPWLPESSKSSSNSCL